MYQYSLDEARRLVTVTALGESDLPATAEAFRETANLLSQRDGWNVLADMRGLASVFNFNEVSSLSQLMGALDHFRGRKVAVVVEKPVHYGSTCQLAGLVGGAGVEVGAFYDLEDALEWVGVPAKT